VHRLLVNGDLDRFRFGSLFTRGSYGSGAPGLMGGSFLFLGNFDGKRIRVEGDLVGVQLTITVANLLPIWPNPEALR
jgi:hypothetical protein